MMDWYVLQTLRSASETHLPGLFGYLSLLADWRLGRDPHSVLQLLPLLIEPGMRAGDVGANRGLFAYWLLRLGAHVTAIEPNPAMCRVLRRRFAREIREGRLVLS